MSWAMVEALSEIVQTAGIFLAGGWAYWRITKERTHRPHIEFGIDCNFYGPKDNEYLVEFLISVHNKGFVARKFNKIFFRVRGITHEESLEIWKNSRLRFSGRILPLKNSEEHYIDLVPSSYKPYLLEPGCKEIITFITKVPDTYDYILPHACYEYEEKGKHIKGKPEHKRTTERVFKVE